MDRDVKVNAFARVDRECEIRYEVAGGEAQFTFGQVRGTCLDIVFDDESLAVMTEKCAEALRQVAVADDGADD